MFDPTLLTFDATKILALLTTVTVAVQALKKMLESLEEGAEPGSVLGKLAAMIAHGWGPVTLVALMSVLALLPDIVKDGALSLKEVAAIGGVFLGTNGIYGLLRKFIFTKTKKE